MKAHDYQFFLNGSDFMNKIDSTLLGLAYILFWYNLIILKCSDVTQHTVFFYLPSNGSRYQFFLNWNWAFNQNFFLYHTLNTYI